MKKIGPNKAGGTIKVASNVTDAILKEIIDSGKPKMATRNGMMQKKPPAPTVRLKKSGVHPLQEMFGERLLGMGGDVTPASLDEDDAVLGVYFSAHWCPPCHTFTPLLKVLYNELRGQGKLFHVVFVSLDMDEHSFSEYFSRMPWLAVDFQDKERRENLADQFGVNGIPNLQLMNPRTQEVYRRNGREMILSDHHGEFFPWVDIKRMIEMGRPPINLPPLREEMERDKQHAKHHAMKSRHSEESQRRTSNSSRHTASSTQPKEIEESKQALEVTGGEPEIHREAKEEQQDLTKLDAGSTDKLYHT